MDYLVAGYYLRYKWNHDVKVSINWILNGAPDTNGWTPEVGWSGSDEAMGLVAHSWRLSCRLVIPTSIDGDFYNS
jgi:hypothetical protein